MVMTEMAFAELVYDSRIIQRAAAIFGPFMRRGHDARNEIGLLLEEAEEQGLITEQEHDRCCL